MGVQSGDNERFLRLWYEVSVIRIGFNINDFYHLLASERKWFPVVSGGEMRKWYGNLDTVINLENGGNEIEMNPKTHSLCNRDLYFKSGITWTRISSGAFSARLAPKGTIYEHSGPVAFFGGCGFQTIMGFLNSSTALYFFRILAPTLDYGAKALRDIPVALTEDVAINDTVLTLIANAKEDWDTSETSWSFAKHPII